MKIQARRRPLIVVLLTVLLTVVALRIPTNQLLVDVGPTVKSPSHATVSLAGEQLPDTVPQSPSASTPSSANYAFTTSTSGSFTDMSSGTTQLVGADRDDAVSAVQTLPFDFYLMGQRFNQFSATS